MCPCGVVYSTKANIRAESSRDYADLLLSWKHFPNVVIYDFARGLVNHCNLRDPIRLPFSPNEGRLAEASPENIAMASKDQLRVHLPWLVTKKDKPDTGGHPITGSAEHYALYDTFHQCNTKDHRDVLRRIGIVPELRGWLNSQRVEQFFSGIRKNNYFMNMFTPSCHVFLMRCIINEHNMKVNKKALADLAKVSRGKMVTINSSGQAVLGLLIFNCHCCKTEKVNYL